MRISSMMIGMVLCLSHGISFAGLEPNEDGVVTIEMEDLRDGDDGDDKCFVLSEGSENTKKIVYGEGVVTSIKDLFLMGTFITEFPIPAGGFPALEKLSLEETGIETFTVQVGDFPNLKILNLSDTGIEGTFTIRKGEFPNLRTLRLSDTLIEVLRIEEDALPNLRQLQVGSLQELYLPTSMIERSDLNIPCRSPKKLASKAKGTTFFKTLEPFDSQDSE